MPADRRFGLKKLFILLLLVSIVVIVVFCIRLLDSDRFYKGIFIEGIDVYGMKRSEAKEAVDILLSTRLYGDTAVLKSGDVRWTIKLSELSFRFTLDEVLDQAYAEGRQGGFAKRLIRIISLRFRNANFFVSSVYDQDRLYEAIYRIKMKVDRAPINARVLIKPAGITVEPDQPGRGMDARENLAVVEQYFQALRFYDIPLEIREKPPKVRYADVSNIRYTVSGYSTAYRVSNQARVHNLQLACSRLNGMVIMPGDVFSMNEALGSRSPESGYYQAPVIFRNEISMGTGGGVCQVTTTLYDAILLAGMEVVSRTPHSIPPSYVKPGLDATISEGYIDFRFRNSTSQAICLAAEAEGGVIHIRILSSKTAPEDRVDLQSQVLEHLAPGKTEYLLDQSLGGYESKVVRKARSGMRVAVYRNIYGKDGRLQKRELISEDIYRPVAGRVKAGKDLYMQQKSY